jgi:DNA primase large subunit
MDVLTNLLGPNVDIEKETLATDAEEEASFMKKMEEAMSPRNAITPDLKIDDRDLKEYPNFFEFCLDPKGLDQAPLARQLVIFTHLFGEWCPFCSHEIFHNLEDFPVDYPARQAGLRMG